MATIPVRSMLPVIEDIAYKVEVLILFVIRLTALRRCRSNVCFKPTVAWNGYSAGSHHQRSRTRLLNDELTHATRRAKISDISITSVELGRVQLQRGRLGPNSLQYINSVHTQGIQ